VSATAREIVTDSIRYWELRRVAYNAVLAAIVAFWIARTWPHFQAALSWQFLPPLLVLAVIANVFYCAAYPADLLMQYSEFRERWIRWRWLLWVAGTAFAVLLEWYWIGDEIYPSCGPSGCAP
jgi:hypothetical protein